VVACAVVGVVLGAAADWRLGVAGVAVTAAIGMLFSVRTSAVVPATARAPTARRRTRHRLSRLASAGYLTLRDRLVAGPGFLPAPGAACGGPAAGPAHAAGLTAPRPPAEHLAAEHLVTGPAGVFVIGSVYWDRRLPVRTARRGRLFHGPVDETAGLRRLERQADEAGRRLSEVLGRVVTVRPVLVIYGPPVPWPVMTIADVDVLSGHRLRWYLRREPNANRAARLAEHQAEVIHAVANRIFPPAH
jgi:hypothetical protein